MEEDNGYAPRVIETLPDTGKAISTCLAHTAFSTGAQLLTVATICYSPSDLYLLTASA